MAAINAAIERMELNLMLRCMLILVMCLLSGPSVEPDGSAETLARFEYTQIVMGVGARLVFYAKDEPSARAAAEATYRRLNELDAILSDYRPDSELMRLCRAEPGKPHGVSPELGFVLSQSIDIATKTTGAFDPTVGPIVRLWRKARKTGRRPNAQALDRARSLVGYEKVSVDPENETVTLLAPGMQLDLGGIAKGYAADEAIKVLTGLGIDRALVDLGGDLTASEPPPGEPAWRVVVDDGVRAPREVELVNGAIATSGDLVQHTIIDGVRYSHIIDPRTGEPVTTAAAATVTAPSGLLADALASAACVDGEQTSQWKLRFDGVTITVQFGAPELDQEVDPQG